MMSVDGTYGALRDANAHERDEDERGRRLGGRTRARVAGVAFAAVAIACAVALMSERTREITPRLGRARAGLGCEDQVCKSVCPNDIGLQSTYTVSPPKFCAKVVGTKYCWGIPSVEFSIPWSCNNICVPVPGYCAVVSAADKYTAVIQANSAQALMNLGALQASVKTEIQNAQSDAQKFATLASKTTVKALLTAGTLDGQLMQVISDSQSVLENIASTLKDKLRNIVSLAWGEMAENAGELQKIIENGILDALDVTSASASLGSSRERAELYADIKGALRSAFSGEEFNLPVESQATIKSARLGSSGKGSCFDMVLTTHSDYSAESYLMPWPEKLKDDSFAPGSFLVKFPSYTTSLCATIQKFNVPSAVAEKIFIAFTSMFDEFFRELYKQTGLETLVEDVKKLGNGKFFGTAGARRLLSAEDERRFVELHLKYREQLSLAEADIFNQIVKFHERLTSPTLGDFATRRETASLGAGAFDDILTKFVDQLNTALKLMTSSTSVDGTFTMAFKTETSLKVNARTTKTGEFLSEIMGMENSFEQVKIFPMPVPGLFVAVDLKVSLNLPYFLKVDAAGEFGVSVDVSFPVDVLISNSPSVKFQKPTVDAKVLGSYEIVAGLQVGVVAQVEHAYIAVCAGAVCAGPELWARQDVYYGMDAFAASLDRSRATCDTQARSLTALWNDWDYSTNTKSQCLASKMGVGGYLQVPKTQLAVSMMMKPIPTSVGSSGISSSAGKDDGADALMPSPALQLYDFTPIIKSAYDMDGNWHMRELFSQCTAPNVAAPRGCAPTCPASIKLKQTLTTANSEYINRCITSNGGKENLPRTAPCESNALDANGRQSQWWQMIPDAAGGSRIRLADSFLCLEAKKALPTQGNPVLVLGNCDAENTAQLFEHVAQCYKRDNDSAGCLRTASRNSFNVDGSPEKPRYAHGWSSNKDRLVNESFIPLEAARGNSYALWEFAIA